VPGAPIIEAMARPRRRTAAVALSALLAGAAAAQAPPAGQMRGLITTARRTPAVGAVVVVRPEGARTPVRLGTTGASGRFAFDGLSDGTYRAEVRREGFAPVVKSGIAVKAPFRAVVELTLVRGNDTPAPPADPAGETGSIRLEVKNGTIPLAEARVRLVLADGSQDPRTGLTDAEGRTVFDNLSAGMWRVEILGAGLLPLRASVEVAGEIEVEAAMAPQPADYQPSPQDLIVPEDVTPP
jgi:carboxypeptidase family protein